MRRDSRESLPPISSDSFPRGRGGFRGRGRGRGDWDYSRGSGLYPEERDNYGPRSRSREREWERPIRDDRDRELEGHRREEDFRRDRDELERDERTRREPPPFRPGSRNSTGGVPTPITSRSTSTTSVHLANIDRFAQNARDSRDLQEPRLRNPETRPDPKPWNVEREKDRGDITAKRRDDDNFDAQIPSPPPQAPPVPAFGSIPQRALVSTNDPPSKHSPPLNRSPAIHPSRLGLLDPVKEAPSAPKALTLSKAPTAPKAQAPERWAGRETSNPVKLQNDNDANKFGATRAATGQTQLIAKGSPSDQIRNISKRFSNDSMDASPTNVSTQPPYGASDNAKPSVKKAVEEQGHNGSAPSNPAYKATMRPPVGDMSNQSSPVKIPTGPRAERAPPPTRQAAPPIARGPSIRGPSMIPRTGRGGAWSWVNPDFPKHTPRGPSQPSIMNVVPTKRDSIGEDRSRAGPPSAESAESAVAKWRRANAPSGTTTNQHGSKDMAPSQPSPGIMHRIPTKLETAIKNEQANDDKSKDSASNADGDKEDESSDEAAGEDNQMDLDEEDFAEAEKKFDREMQALEAKRPPTPRSHPQLLVLLDELDALATALEEKTKANQMDGNVHSAPVSMGLPSPKVGDAEEYDYKPEQSISPVPIKARPQTPPIEGLPFLNNGPPTPFSEIDDLQEDLVHQGEVEDVLVERLMKQRDLFFAEEKSIKADFASLYRPWRMTIEDFEDERKTENALADSSATDESPATVQAPSVVGRRGRVISDLGFTEALRMSQNTFEEEKARREREALVYLPAKTFNPEREAVVPDMLDEFEAQDYLYTDINNKIKTESALELLCFVPQQDDFTSAEKETFLYNYLLYPKRFGLIAEALEGRDFRDCVQHYYLTKHLVKYKDQEAAFLKTKKGRKMASQMRSQIRPRASGLMSTFDGNGDYEAQNIALTEKGRPKRAAAPTFGDVVEAETNTPAVTSTPVRRGAAASKDSISGPVSSEKPATRRTRAPTKEKPGRKPKAQLLATTPAPSPQKPVPENVRGVSKEPVVTESSPRIDELDGAQVLAGLSSGHPFPMQIYPQPTPEVWPTSRPSTSNLDHIPQYVPQVAQEQPHPPQQRATTTPQTSSYWSVPERQDFHNLVRHFGTNWQAIASTMKTKTHTMVNSSLFSPLTYRAKSDLRSKISIVVRSKKAFRDSSWSKKLSKLMSGLRMGKIWDPYPLQLQPVRRDVMLTVS